MKKIINIISIAIIVLFAVACTNEEETNDKTLSSPINSISGKGSNRIYSQYEPIGKYTDANIQTMVDGFNNILNSQGEVMPDYAIEDAVIMLETHFNYGVVFKLPYNQNAEEYFEPLNFKFTVPLRANKVNGENLKPLYFTFVNYILTQMSNKNLEFSDIYVEEINETTVTFGLDMIPSVKAFPNGAFALRKFKERGEAINIPSNCSSTWSNMNSGDIEHNVYRFSFKNMISDNYIYTQITNGVTLAIDFSHQTENAGDLVYFNNIELQPITASSVWKAYTCLQINNYHLHGYKVFDYGPRVDITHPTIGGVEVDNYQLEMSYIKFAMMNQINISELFMSSISNKWDLRE